MSGKAQITPTLTMGTDCPLALIGGPCVVESEDFAWRSANVLAEICERLRIPFVFKASFDKANRTSSNAFRGSPLPECLRLFRRIRDTLQLPVLTDIHETYQAPIIAEYVDIIQIPAFLCRQTDLLVAAAQTGRAVNVKKGQFLAPWDMQHVVHKLRQAGASNVLLTERGTSFGYNTLVVDFRSLPILHGLDCPVIFDGTHAVQIPGGLAHSSGGERQYVGPLVRAAVAVGVDGLFLEIHEDPARALSDGPTMLELSTVERFLAGVVRLRQAREEIEAEGG